MSKLFRLKNIIHSVGTNLFLIFFLSIVAFVLTIGLVSYNISKKTISSQVSNSSLQTVVQANEKLDYMFNDFEMVANQIVNNNELIDQLWQLIYFDMDQDKKIGIHRNLLKQFNNLLLSTPNVTGIYVLNEKGSFGTANKTIPADFIVQDWYKKTIEKNGDFLWLEPREQGYLGLGKAKTKQLAVAKVLKNSINDTIGVLLIEIDSSILTETLTKLKMDSGNVVVRAPSGQIVASADNTFTDQIKLLQINETSGQITLKADKLNALVVYTVSKVTKWALVGIIPEQILYAEANKIYRITLICAASAALLAIAIGYLMARRIGTPLIQIRNLMQEAAQGNLRVKSNLRRKDEIGQLSNSFNQMIDKITLLISETNHLAQEVLSKADDIASASNKTSASAKEIVLATNSIALGATMLADEAMQGNEITQNTHSQLLTVVDSNMEMAESAVEVRKVSKQGIDYMSNLTKDTNTAEQTALAMNEKVKQLKESTGSIEKIIEVMEQINSQTKVLSLNAGIEASRVGAAGKGFMVISNEIRSLANQSRESIQVVAQILNTIQKEINGTVSSFSKLQPIYLAQVNSVKEANGIFQKVHDFMEIVISKLESSTTSVNALKQSQTALADSIGNVSAVSQESASSSEQVAALSENQLTISHDLVQLSSQLKEMSDALQESLMKFRV